MAKPSKTKLNDRQRRFCIEYLKDFNAAAAYLRAGYKGSHSTARVSASKLLTNPNVQAFLSELRSRTEAQNIVTLERTLQETARIAFSNISKVIEITEDSRAVVLKSFDEIDEDTLRAIESVKETQAGRSVKMHPKLPALEALLKYFGAYSDLNVARATLKRYGLALEPDPNSELGYVLEKHVTDPAAAAAAEADQVSEATED